VIEIVAEIGTAHRGSLERAEKLIRAAAGSGADTAKFQIVFAREILHPATGTVPLPGGETPLYEVFESLEQPASFYASLKEICEAEGLNFLASPFGMESAALLKALEPRAVKVASPELNYSDFLRVLASWNIPMILSSGVSRMEDLEEAVALVRAEAVQTDLTLLHCVTSYPAPEDEYNLSLLPRLAEDLGVKVGVSDHSGDPSLIPCTALRYGAVMVEKHFALSREGAGLDDPIALEPDDFRLMCERLRELESLGPGGNEDRMERALFSWFGRERVLRAAGDGIKRLAPAEKANYGRTNRSVHASFTLEAGTVLKKENCAVLRTEKILRPGMHPRYYAEIMGRRLARRVPAGEGIRAEDLA
jgi:N-acetylneuraminate synthase